MLKIGITQSDQALMQLCNCAKQRSTDADLRDSCMDKFFKIKVVAEIIAEYRGGKESVDFLEELQQIQQKYLAVKAA